MLINMNKHSDISMNFSTSTKQIKESVCSPRMYLDFLILLKLNISQFDFRWPGWF